MMPLLVHAPSVPPQAWRNGGGRTRELLVWPAQGDWQLRISRADIEADGAFSDFAGTTRWFCVLHGDGVGLRFADAERRLLVGDAPLQFAGAPAPSCRLLGGATQDLNLMLRQGQATMQAWRFGQAWDETFAMRGLYTTRAGHLSDGMSSFELKADTLAWWEQSSPTAWTFSPTEAAAGGSACWLGYSPPRKARI